MLLRKIVYNKNNLLYHLIFIIIQLLFSDIQWPKVRTSTWFILMFHLIIRDLDGIIPQHYKFF